MNTEILDKQVIIIDSEKCVFNSSGSYDYYFDLQTPIKNALFVKILESYVVFNNLYTSSALINNNRISNLDSINININNYKRIATNTSQTNDYIVNNYFDTIIIDTSKYLQEYILSQNSGITSFSPLNYTFKNDYNSDTDINSHSMYILNPVDPSLKRFNITLYDKTNNIIQIPSVNNNIKKILIKICVYTNRMKLTMN